MVVRTEQFSDTSRQDFILALRQRVGNDMEIDIQYVDDIPKEKGGKFRLVKNNLKTS